MEKRPMTLEDSFIIQSLSDVQITADGRMIAFVVGDSFKLKGKPAHSEIWIVETDKPETARPFTSTERSDFAPRWSPDGTRLAYVAAEGGSPQLYVRWMGTGESARITGLPESPSALAWSPDGRRIAYSNSTMT